MFFTYKNSISAQLTVWPRVLIFPVTVRDLIYTSCFTLSPNPIYYLFILARAGSVKGPISYHKIEQPICPWHFDSLKNHALNSSAKRQYMLPMLRNYSIWRKRSIKELDIIHSITKNVNTIKTRKRSWQRKQKFMPDYTHGAWKLGSVGILVSSKQTKEQKKNLIIANYKITIIKIHTCN